MKRLSKIIFLIAAGFTLGVGFKEIKAEVQAKRQAEGEKIAYATQPVLYNKPFVVITYAQENEDFVEQSLLSVVSQNYTDFRVIYIDDGLDKDSSFIEKYDQEGRVTFVKNRSPLGSAESLYRAVHKCDSEEIVVLLRSDEMFAHNDVLNNLNRYFADPSVWIASGEEVQLNSFDKGAAGKSYQVFYAGLFRI